MTQQTLQQRWTQRVGEEPSLEDLEFFKAASIDAAVSRENTLDDIKDDVRTHYPEYSESDVEQVFTNVSEYRLRQQQLAKDEERRNQVRSASRRKLARWSAITLIGASGLGGAIGAGVHVYNGYQEPLENVGVEMHVSNIEAQVQEKHEQLNEAVAQLKLDRADFNEYMQLQQEQLQKTEQQTRQDLADKEAYLNAGIAEIHKKTFPRVDEIFATYERGMPFVNGQTVNTVVRNLALESIAQTYANAELSELLDTDFNNESEYFQNDLYRVELTYDRIHDGKRTQAYELFGGDDFTVIMQRDGDHLVAVHTYEKRGSNGVGQIHPHTSVMQQDGTVYRVNQDQKELLRWNGREWVHEAFSEQLNTQSIEVAQKVYQHRDAGPQAPFETSE